MKRLYSLDYLRGLAAFFIMIYHYLSWIHGNFTAETFMGRIGVYGVSIFYILSGLTLFYVYHNKMVPSKTDVLDFVKKRILRIFPLLWLVTICSVVILKEFPDPLKLVLNLTGLFGLVQWNNYYAVGAWSIGNELVFYIFFPFFMLFAKKSNLLFISVSVILFGIYIYFAFFNLDSNKNFVDQWGIYVNPLNQVFLFLGGFLIGYAFLNIDIKQSLNLFICLLGVVGK